MPKRGPLRGSAKKGRPEAAGASGKGKPAAKSAPFALKWDEDVESSDDSSDEMTRKKAKRPLDDDDDEDFEEEEMDAEQHRKQYVIARGDFLV